MSLAEASNNDFVKQHAAMIYTTVNHTNDFNKFRIVFELERTITKASEMKHALNGISRKFGGDPSCTDACRMFYGSKDCNPIILGNILPNDVLDELIVIGGESSKPKNRIDNTSENTRATFRSNHVLDVDTTVIDKNGNISRIIDIAPGTQVRCPVHLDNNPSAFTLLSQSGVPGVYCSACGTTYFTSSDVPLFDFNHGLTNLDTLEAEDITITDNEEYLVYNQSPIIRYSEKYLPQTNTNTQVVLVKSPKGSGKTEWLSNIVQQCKEDEKSVLLIGHRRSLITSIARRLGLYYSHMILSLKKVG